MMTKSTFVNLHLRRFWTIKTDVPNRRVTVLYGKIGMPGGRKVRDRKTLLSNDAVRELAESLIENRIANGYEQVA